MTDVVETAILVATGPSKIELSPEGDAKQPTGFSGSGTYTVSNKGPNRLTVLMSGNLEPVPAGGNGAQPGGAAPANASVKVTPPRVVLDPGANAQAKADVLIPAGTAEAKAMLEVVFRDEQKPEEINASYTSSVEVPKSTKPTNWKLILLIVAIVLVVLIGAAIAFFLFKGGGGKEFAIPEVHNLSVKDATEKLATVEGCKKSPCFEVKTQEKVDTDPTVDIGNVIKSDPAVGQKAKSGSTVKLIVMKGVEVPDVNNVPEQTARDRLSSACSPAPCLSATTISSPSFELNAGLAMSTVPAAHQSAKKGTTVTLYVSSGSHHLVLSSDPPDNADIDNEASKTPDLYAFKLVSISVLSSGTSANFTAKGDGPFGGGGCFRAGRNTSGWVKSFLFTSLSPGTHLCLRTSAGRNAELIVSGVSSNIALDYVLWSHSILDDLRHIPQKAIFGKLAQP